MRELLREVARGVTALVWPAQCAGCGEVVDEGVAFCAECVLGLDQVGVGCARCGEPAERALSACGRCAAAPPAFAGAVALGRYGGPLGVAANDASAKVRVLALPLWASLAPPDEVAAVADAALGSPGKVAGLREASVAALGEVAKTKPELALPKLELLIDDRQMSVRLAAARAPPHTRHLLRRHARWDPWDHAAHAPAPPASPAA